MSKSSFEQTVKRVSYGARVLDAVLAVGMGAAALYFGVKGDLWWAAGLGLSALLCAYTASTGPLERFFGKFRGRIVTAAERHDMAMPSAPVAGETRQARRARERSGRRD